MERVKSLMILPGHDGAQECSCGFALLALEALYVAVMLRSAG